MDSRDYLLQLLANDLPDYSKYEIIIWGTGNTSLLFQQGLKRFAISHPWFAISAYCDSASEKWGTGFCGKTVISPAELKARASKTKVAVMICALSPNACHEIKDTLNKIGIQYRFLDEVILKTEAENVLRCYDLLDDDTSKNTYLGIICSRIRRDDMAQSFSEFSTQYFSHPVLQMSRPPETFIDCGAFTGDTLEELLKFKNGKIGKYIAFEPDEENFEKLCKNAENQKKTWNLADNQVVLYNCAVGDENDFFHHSQNYGMCSMLVQDSNTSANPCKVVSLDNFLNEEYTFLKADIESHEYSMLCGAQKTIRQYHPFLAISIYHNTVDLYSIPLLLHDFVPEYHFSLMQHAELFVDTVLYCWC